jgi:hypothetical protein
MSNLVILVVLILLPIPAFAQSNSNIAGVVKDSSGAVLPGVTVEAASPSLIEKVRTVVTDSEGQYKVINLVPGTYSVTFSLPGFSSVRREGILLTAAFTANVSVDMRIGNLEETITVTGEASTVDVQSVVTQKVVTRDVLDAIPTGSKSYESTRLQGFEDLQTAWQPPRPGQSGSLQCAQRELGAGAKQQLRIVVAPSDYHHPGALGKVD